MANYKETNLAGTSYIRSHRVEVVNGEVEKAIYFNEQKIINLDDGEVIRREAGSVGSEFTAENASTEFALLNPETGEVVGAPMTYQDVYVALYSLYIHLALERDAAEENA